jgi:hypothetical protein
MSLGDPFQRLTSINDRPWHWRLDHASKEEVVILGRILQSQIRPDIPSL